MNFSQRVRRKFMLKRRYKRVINFLAGKFLPIFVELDFWVGLRILKIGATDLLVLLFFATIIANIGGPDDTYRHACSEQKTDICLCHYFKN